GNSARGSRANWTYALGLAGGEPGRLAAARGRGRERGWEVASPHAHCRSGRAQVQGVRVVRGEFCSGGAQASIATVTSVMMTALGNLVEGLPHGDCNSANQSRGSLTFGAGGDTQAQRSGAPRYLLSSAPCSCPLVWPWCGGPPAGDSRWSSC